MRVKPHQVRAIAAVAIQRASERELRALYEVINDLSASAFVELVRDIEDEIDSSLAIGLERGLDQNLPGIESSNLYSELERIRRQELRVPVYRFAEFLSESLKEDPSIARSEFPAFDSRRGLQVWIRRLVRAYSEQQIYRAVMNLRDGLGKAGGTAWKLR
ncbi:MAG: hypothetical protein ABJ242_08845 [Marinomonas sp.]